MARWAQDLVKNKVTDAISFILRSLNKRPPLSDIQVRLISHLFTETESWTQHGYSTLPHEQAFDLHVATGCSKRVWALFTSKLDLQKYGFIKHIKQDVVLKGLADKWGSVHVDGKPVGRNLPFKHMHKKVVGDMHQLISEKLDRFRAAPRDTWVVWGEESGAKDWTAYPNWTLYVATRWGLDAYQDIAMVCCWLPIAHCRLWVVLSQSLSSPVGALVG